MSSNNLTNDSEVDRKPSPKAEDGSIAKPATASRGRRRRLKFKDTINPHAERVQAAADVDIIFGRGRGFQDHPGNKRMRSIVSRHKAQYRALELSKKRALVEAVYDEIIESGARFLHKQGDEDSFVMVEVPVALQKVRNLLRCKKVFGKTKSEQSEQTKTIGSFEGVGQIMNSASSPDGGLSEGAVQSSAIQPPLVGASTELGNLSVAIQPSSVAQITDVSSPSLPLHLSPTPLLVMDQMRQQASLASRQSGRLDPTGLQPLNWTGSLPNPFAIQMTTMRADANNADQLQVFQQYQQLRAAELANLMQSNKQNGDR